MKIDFHLDRDADSALVTELINRGVSHSTPLKPSEDCPTCGKAAIYHPQCGYAMGTLLRRLVGEGYIAAPRTNELLERAHHLVFGRGFITDAEHKARQTKPQTEEDLLS